MEAFEQRREDHMVQLAAAYYRATRGGHEMKMQDFLLDAGRFVDAIMEESARRRGQLRREYVKEPK
jgi:hypothetical protein